MTLVSIIIPTYNYATFLREAIDSALKQSTGDVAVEIIVVDDGSTDETPEILKSYEGDIQSVRTSNKGVIHARNTGLKLIKGEFWCSLDADNLLAPSYVREMVQALQGRPEMSFAYCDRLMFSETEERQAEGIDFELDAFRVKNFIDMNTVLFRSEATQGHWFDERFRLSWDDYDYCMTLIEKGHRCFRVPQTLVRYRMHENSLTASFKREANDYHIHKVFLKKHGSAYPPEIIRRTRAGYANRELVRILNHRLPERPLRDRLWDLGRFILCKGPLNQFWNQVRYTVHPGGFPR